MEKHHKELKLQIEKHEKELAEALENLRLEQSHRERLEDELGSQRLQFAQLERVEKELRGASPQVQRDSEVCCCLTDHLIPFLTQSQNTSSNLSVLAVFYIKSTRLRLLLLCTTLA